jgi:hypothetical protein
MKSIYIIIISFFITHNVFSGEVDFETFSIGMSNNTVNSIVSNYIIDSDVTVSKIDSRINDTKGKKYIFEEKRIVSIKNACVNDKCFDYKLLISLITDKLIGIERIQHFESNLNKDVVTNKIVEKYGKPAFYYSNNSGLFMNKINDEYGGLNNLFIGIYEDLWYGVDDSFFEWEYTKEIFSNLPKYENLLTFYIWEHDKKSSIIVNEVSSELFIDHIASMGILADKTVAVFYAEKETQAAEAAANFGDYLDSHDISLTFSPVGKSLSEVENNSIYNFDRNVLVLDQEFSDSSLANIMSDVELNYRHISGLGEYQSKDIHLKDELISSVSLAGTDYHIDYSADGWTNFAAVGKSSSNTKFIPEVRIYSVAESYKFNSPLLEEYLFSKFKDAYQLNSNNVAEIGCLDAHYDVRFRSGADWFKGMPLLSHNQISCKDSSQKLVVYDLLGNFINDSTFSKFPIYTNSPIQYTIPNSEILHNKDMKCVEKPSTDWCTTDYIKRSEKADFLFLIVDTSSEKLVKNLVRSMSRLTYDGRYIDESEVYVMDYIKRYLNNKDESVSDEIKL